ncbi:ferredoxin [Demequina aurantiaca]|uniref:ferredoxin n=1 Tax=Demequina aurantiaca TaxID=676200 RepID=UPI0007814FBE|nr:ferredoxin [Demequina aurantiaca]
MINVKVDMSQCQHYGQCVLEAPSVFELNAKDRLEYVAQVADDEREAIEDAIDICPMQAISMVQ